MGIQRIRDFIFLVLIFIGINLTLIAFASIGLGGISCEDVSQKYNTTIEVNNDTNIVGVTRSGVSILVGFISGECEGLPSWFLWLDLAMFIGLLFLARSFIGAT